MQTEFSAGTELGTASESDAEFLNLKLVGRQSVCQKKLLFETMGTKQNPKAEKCITIYELLFKEAQKTRESLAIAHGCLPKRDAKTLMLKRPYTLVV